MAGKNVEEIVCGEDLEASDDAPVNNDNDNETANDSETLSDLETNDGSNLEDDDVSPSGKKVDDGCSCSFVNI